MTMPRHSLLIVQAAAEHSYTFAIMGTDGRGLHVLEPRRHSHSGSEKQHSASVFVSPLVMKGRDETKGYL